MIASQRHSAARATHVLTQGLACMETRQRMTFVITTLSVYRGAV